MKWAHRQRVGKIKLNEEILNYIKTKAILNQGVILAPEISANLDENGNMYNVEVLSISIIPDSE